MVVGIGRIATLASQQNNGTARTRPPRRKIERPRSARAEVVKRISPKQREVTQRDRRLWRSAAIALLVGSSLLAGIIGSERILLDFPRFPLGHLFGPSGALVGGALLRWFGFGAFVLPLSLWLHGRRLHQWTCPELPAPAPLTWRSVSVSVSGCMLAVVTALALFADTRGGGVVGSFLAQQAHAIIGPAGTLLICVTALLVLAPHILGCSVATASRIAANRVGVGARHACVTVPSVVLGPPLRGTAKGAAFVAIRSKRLLHRALYRKNEPIPLKMVIEQGRPQVTAAKRRPARETSVESGGTQGIASSTVASSPVPIIPPEAPKRVPLKDRVLDDYVFPPIKLLAETDHKHDTEDGQELQLRAQRIEQKLADFNIKGRIVASQRGPVVSLFEFEPAPGVKLGRIVSLQDDLAMSLRASVVRIVAPMPGRGTVGIEVPNPRRDVVRLREVLESEDFHTHSSNLAVPLGKDISGLPVVVDIAAMPHLLIAGATGTGKSVCLNAVLVSLLYRATPQELGLIMIDPKVLELSVYDGIPHLRVPVVTVPKQAKAVLEWAVREMDQRYRLMQRFGVRNIDGFNRIAKGEVDPDALEDALIQDEEPPVSADSGVDQQDREGGTPSPGAEVIKPLPKILIVVDELADLMLQVGRDIEELITRLAQKARAAGIHLILATQRPSVDVITGLIKANFPARLSFRVTSRIDSRTILDSMGAERLLGKGDMLFMAPGANPLRRVHGALVTDAEVNRVVNAIRTKDGPRYDESIVAFCEAALRKDAEEGGGEGRGEEDEYDPFYDKAVELVVEKQHASTSLVQRVFRIGYNRAARIIERMEREGLVSAQDGARPREVLVQQGPGEVPN